MAFTDKEREAFAFLRSSGVSTGFAERELLRAGTKPRVLDFRLWTILEVSRSLGPDGLPDVQQLVDGIGVIAMRQGLVADQIDAWQEPGVDEFWRTIIV